MRRVTLGGEELTGFLDEHQGPNIKVFVPSQDQRRPVLPSSTATPVATSGPRRTSAPRCGPTPCAATTSRAASSTWTS
ncbi:siderophore-interacting protein [Saccharopolyspora erythraea]|nr:siderophore-interacting protein [Saccharopolyspora erythraea]